MKKDESIDYALRATWQAVARMYNEEAGKFGTTMATGFTLLSIDKETGTPSTTLGPKMGMEATSLSRILRSMEEKGLIYRQTDEIDKRKVLIFLTDKGFQSHIRNQIIHLFYFGFLPCHKNINQLLPC